MVPMRVYVGGVWYGGMWCGGGGGGGCVQLCSCAEGSGYVSECSGLWQALQQLGCRNNLTLTTVMVPPPCHLPVCVNPDHRNGSTFVHSIGLCYPSPP